MLLSAWLLGARTCGDAHNAPLRLPHTYVLETAAEERRSGGAEERRSGGGGGFSFHTSAFCFGVLEKTN